MKINVLGVMAPIFGEFAKGENLGELFSKDYKNYILSENDPSIVESKIENETNNLVAKNETDAIKLESEKGNLSNSEKEKLNEENKKRLKDIILQYCGTISGECYCSDSMATLIAQPSKKAFARAQRCSDGGHLSVFGHYKVTLEFVDFPKALLMLLNNNHLNNTSERSGRYTSMQNACRSEQDLNLYNKWHEIFVDKIAKTYGTTHPNIFTPAVIDKKANENARYIISSFYKTSMVYTNDIREFTHISKTIEEILKNENMHPFYKGMKDELIEFNTLLKGTGLVFEEFNDQTEKDFGLIAKDNKIITPYYGDCIADTYKLSLSIVAHLHRHRFTNISIAFDKDPTFFVPPIIADDKALVENWLNDCKSQIDVIPQALLVNVNEIIPAKLLPKKYGERLCYNAQLEFCNCCVEQVKRILKNLDPNTSGVREIFENIKGSRCTWQKGYKCSNPCGFIEGIKCTRKI